MSAELLGAGNRHKSLPLLLLAALPPLIHHLPDRHQLVQRFVAAPLRQRRGRRPRLGLGFRTGPHRLFQVHRLCQLEHVVERADIPPQDVRLDGEVANELDPHVRALGLGLPVAPLWVLHQPPERSPRPELVDHGLRLYRRGARVLRLQRVLYLASLVARYPPLLAPRHASQRGLCGWLPTHRRRGSLRLHVSLAPVPVRLPGPSGEDGLHDLVHRLPIVRVELYVRLHQLPHDSQQLPVLGVHLGRAGSSGRVLRLRKSARRKAKVAPFGSPSQGMPFHVQDGSNMSNCIKKTFIFYFISVCRKSPKILSLYIIEYLYFSLFLVMRKKVDTTL